MVSGKGSAANVNGALKSGGLSPSARDLGCGAPKKIFRL